MTDQPVCVLGAGGHAKVVIQTLREAHYQVQSIYDDDPEKHGHRVLGVEVKGTLAEAAEQGCAAAVIGIGDNRTRADIAQRFPQLAWVSAIYPSAVVAPDLTIGAGTVIFAGAVVQPGTVIEEHAIINTSATVDHDCLVSSFSHIAPGCHLAGHVMVGEGALMGIGSIAIPSMHIGPWATVGAGAVVIHNVDTNAVVVGNPAHPIHQNRSGEQTNQSSPVAIIGSGGHAITVISTLIEAGYGVSALFDDDVSRHGRYLLGYEIVGYPRRALAAGFRRGIIAIGDNISRRRMAARLDGIEWLTLIHPKAYIHSSATIGVGSVAMIDAVIRTDSRVGAHTIVNTKAVVGHDCTVGDFAHIAGGVHMGGGSVVEEGAFLGLGVVVVPGKRVGAWSTVGAGAVVVDDIPPGVLAVGVPARPIKRIERD